VKCDLEEGSKHFASNGIVVALVDRVKINRHLAKWEKKMDNVTFIFVVLPLTVGFVGFVFLVIFGADLLRWYNARNAPPRKTTLQRTAAEPGEETEYFEPVSHRREKELASR
jgi:hypothetical protein